MTSEPLVQPDAMIFRTDVNEDLHSEVQRKYSHDASRRGSSSATQARKAGQVVVVFSASAH